MESDNTVSADEIEATRLSLDQIIQTAELLKKKLGGPERNNNASSFLPSSATSEAADKPIDGPDNESSTSCSSLPSSATSDTAKKAAILKNKPGSGNTSSTTDGESSARPPQRRLSIGQVTSTAEVDDGSDPPQRRLSIGVSPNTQNELYTQMSQPSQSKRSGLSFFNRGQTTVHPQNDDIETGSGTGGSRKTVRFSKAPQRKDSERGAWKMVSPIRSFALYMLTFSTTQTHVNISLLLFVSIHLRLVDGQGGIANHR